MIEEKTGLFIKEQNYLVNRSLSSKHFLKQTHKLNIKPKIKKLKEKMRV